MEDKILIELKNAEDYVSGEYLSTTLNVSRTAIWKHINNLKKKGYIISGISNKGYKLVSSPDLLTAPEVLPLLKTKFIGQNLIHFEEIDSTNIKAKELAIKGAENGTIVISETQNLGSGRFNRAWTSPKGGIWFTIILRPELPPNEAPKITQIVAASMHKSLKKFNINTAIKWPNDVLLNDKKICGILSEMKCDMDLVHYLIVGIGLNVNIDSNFFNTDELISKATSLQIEYNQQFKRSEILAEFLNTFEPLYEDFLNNLDISETVSICRENSNLIGKKAKLITYNKEEIVTCVGLSDTGDLIIIDSNNKKRPVISGEISFKYI